MRRHLALVALAAVSLAAAGGQPASASRSESYTYVAGNGDVGSLNCDGGLKVTETTFGGTCFDILVGDTTVSFSTDDATGEVISLTYSFEDAAGDPMVGYPQVCGGATDLVIPAGAQTLVVYYDTAYTLFNTCGTPGTTGTVTATYA